MKKILIIPAFIALMATSCGESSKGSGEAWAQKYKDEMIQYIGEVLPYVPLNEDTMYSGWDEDESCYYIGDDNDNDLLADYGTRLTKNGNWTATVDTNNQVCYTKESSIGTLTLYAKWYEADTDAVAGNEIDVYVTGGQVIPGGEVTGTYTFKMSDAGWANQEVISEKTIAPGLIVNASKNGGSTNPAYYNNGADLRLYTKNSITFSAINMTEIEFTFTRIDDNTTFTPNSGTFTPNVSGKSGKWVGEASSVTFTMGDTSGKQYRISEVTVTGTFSGEGGQVDPGEDERTTLSVAKDIAFNLFGPDVDYETDVELYEGDYYVTALSELETAQATVEEGKKYLPDYVELDTDTIEDTDEAGFWYAIYIDVDFYNNGIVVQINSYVDDTYGLLLEYSIYTVNN